MALIDVGIVSAASSEKIARDTSRFASTLCTADSASLPSSGPAQLAVNRRELVVTRLELVVDKRELMVNRQELVVNRQELALKRLLALYSLSHTHTLSGQ